MNLIDQLEEVNNERELFENLLKQTIEKRDEAIVTASRIVAGRDLKFDLIKLIKEHETDNSGRRPKVSIDEKTKEKISA